MTAIDRWKQLGWKSAVWELVRLYCALPRSKNCADGWKETLREGGCIRVGNSQPLSLDPQVVVDLLAYLVARDADEAALFVKLRDEAAAVKACTDLKLTVGKTQTQSADHHQSSTAVVALVEYLVRKVCAAKNVPYNAAPQSRCVWVALHHLHVTARRIDGAIPGLANPEIIWEIKEYWGRGGGSKMSDAVYECHLVGRELREFELVSGIRVCHMVFLDGLGQWSTRRSDLRRFVDLTNQGLIDHLIVGTDIETELEKILGAELDARKSARSLSVSAAKPTA